LVVHAGGGPPSSTTTISGSAFDGGDEEDGIRRVVLLHRVRRHELDAGEAVLLEQLAQRLALEASVVDALDALGMEGTVFVVQIRERDGSAVIEMSPLCVA
jgi:hypothetical protein